MSETIKDAVRAYGRRHGMTNREAEYVILGAGLAVLEGNEDKDRELVRTMRLGMTVALNLISEDRDRIIDRAWGVVNDCDDRTGIVPIRPHRPESNIAPVVELRVAR